MAKHNEFEMTQCSLHAQLNTQIITKMNLKVTIKELKRSIKALKCKAQHWLESMNFQSINHWQ